MFKKHILAFRAFRNDPAVDAFADFGESIDTPSSGTAAPATKGSDEPPVKTPEEIAAEAAAGSDDGKKTPEEIAAEAAAGAGGDDNEEDIIGELSLEEIESLKNLPPKPADDEYGWDEIARELGIEDSETVTDLSQIKEKVTGMKEAVKVQAVEEFLLTEKGYTPEAIAYIQALNNGATPDQIYEIEAPYRDFLNIPNEDKVRRSFEILQKDGVALYTEAEIDAKIEGLIETGKLAEEAAKLDNSVRTMMAEKRAQYFKEVNERIEATRTAAKQIEQKLNNAVIKALKETTSYLGMKLPAEVTDAMARKFESGVYRKAMEKDPNAIYKYILATELGDKALQKLVGDKNGQFRKDLQARLKGESEAAQQARIAAGASEAGKAAGSKDDPFANFPDTLDGMEFGGIVYK